MAKRNVRTTIPHSKPDDLLTLGKAILKKHDADPAASQVPPAAIDRLRPLVVAADSERTTAEDLRTKAVAHQELGDKHLGVGKGQTTETEGTALYEITGIRDTLLGANRGKEEQLSVYGFAVVVTEGPAAGTAAKKKV